MTVCVSLGGSRLEVGLISDQPNGSSYFGSGPVDWRKALSGATSARALCDLIASHLAVLLDNLGIELRQEIDLGVAFPGPQANGVWFSNNLTDDFRRGVPLEKCLKEALWRRCGLNCGRIVIVLDAQADAGAELYHPDGALAETKSLDCASVINIATGIAAGFVDPTSRWGVLNTENEFKIATHGCFDSGGGQLGRHLFASFDGRWTYHYRPRGQIASSVDGVRMTEYLSGPALTARLALELVRRGERFGCEQKDFGWAEKEAKRFLDRSAAVNQLRTDVSELSTIIRENGGAVSGSLLGWADQMLDDKSLSIPLYSILHSFRETVMQDFGRALSVFQSERGWQRFSRNIVLTGGVGQNLFRQTGSWFVSRIGEFLYPNTLLVRSRLVGGGERSAWFFHAGVFK